MIALRRDRGTGALAALASPRHLASGAVVLTGRAARVGAHQYATRVEHRDLAELHRIVAQLPGVPVTVAHRGLCSEGTCTPIGTVRRSWIEHVDGVAHAAVEIMVHDASDLPEERELSLGYFTKVDAAGFQRDTKVDHLSIVSTARCGSTCSIEVAPRADCKCGGQCSPCATRGDATYAARHAAAKAQIRARLEEHASARSTRAAFIARERSQWRQTGESDE